LMTAGMVRVTNLTPPGSDDASRAYAQQHQLMSASMVHVTNQPYSSGMTYPGHGAWDGPKPMGDPSKPAPGTPYYVKAPPEPVHDVSKEQLDVPLGVGGGGCGRLPMLGGAVQVESSCDP
jgi:hypothetical protein